LAWSGQAKYIVLFAGDSDFVPAIKSAKEAGAIVKIVHTGPPQSEQAPKIHEQLRQACDEEQVIDMDFLKRFVID